MIELNDLFIDNYINNEIKQFNGQGTYGACDLLLNDIFENIILCVIRNYVIICYTYNIQAIIQYS